MNSRNQDNAVSLSMLIAPFNNYENPVIFINLLNLTWQQVKNGDVQGKEDGCSPYIIARKSKVKNKTEGCRFLY